MERLFLASPFWEVPISFEEQPPWSMVFFSTAATSTGIVRAQARPDGEVWEEGRGDEKQHLILPLKRT